LIVIASLPWQNGEHRAFDYEPRSVEEESELTDV
jgi:hypothetical protein